MTNEQAKQEAIKKAYGEEFNSLKPDCLGRIDFFKFREIKNYKLINPIQLDAEGKYWCPFILKGIKNNNGWIRIEPDGSNLPKQECEYMVVLKSGNRTNLYFDPKEDLSFNPIATHYRPIEEIPNPIY